MIEIDFGVCRPMFDSPMSLVDMSCLLSRWPSAEAAQTKAGEESMPSAGKSQGVNRSQSFPRIVE